MRSPTGARASAYVRVCAWKSRLLGSLEATSLNLAADATAMQRAVAALGLQAPFERLLHVYQMALRSYPDAAPLLASLLRLHEIENVKLLWRVIVRGHDRRSAKRLWVPIGPLATVPTDALDATKARDLMERLARTPFGPIVTDVARAYNGDLGAAELAFDRWASLQVLAEARKLPRTESLARRLMELVVRERDSEILRRGERWFGLSEGAVQTERVWRRAPSPAAERPRAAAPTPSRPEDPVALRAQRLRLCRRAFVGDPFAVAPAVALVLLAEEELRGVRALIERQGEPSLDAAAARAMAGAQFGP